MGIYFISQLFLVIIAIYLDGALMWKLVFNSRTFIKVSYLWSRNHLMAKAD